MALTRFLKPTEKIVQRSCKLKSLTPNLPDLELTENKIEIGRSKSTGITDVFCSKKQILLKADLIKCVVSIKSLGSNPSGLNGFMLAPGKGYEGFHGDVIELLYGKYQYEISFDPKPAELESKKRNSSIDEESSNVAKKMKLAVDDVKGVWESLDSGKLIIYNSPGVVASEKIACYDVDGTLIKTKSGNTFPKSTDDWQIIYSEVPGKLKSLLANGFKIVIFTNQAGVGSGKVKLEDFKHKLEAIISKLGVPVQAFIATNKSIYRKPLTGMWNYLSEKENNGVTIKLDKSFYVGDAAGRPDQTIPVKRKKDHSSADRLMALNVGLEFYTPEEHFLNHKPAPWIRPKFDPRNNNSGNQFEPENTKIPSDKAELIVMVGLPGSGKSFFAKSKLEPLGYEVINRDTLKTAQKCISVCESALKNGKRCVIDNTNVDKESRKRYISIAKTFGASCRCFMMNVSFEHLRHNIVFREFTDKEHLKVNEMILNSMKKKLEEPSIAEGFSEVVKVNLIQEFTNKDHENLYRMFLLEK